MKNRSIITCLILTILFSVPSLIRIPAMLPFIDSEVRAKAPLAIEEMRKNGFWMVNADIESITKEGGRVCYHWKHQYRSRFEFGEVEFITTCL
ncbi:hypothetical protein KJ652_00130 [Patescibacteria group bacterium]|nr:hypothetical protein [Patescibacteria group bacterium]MBU1122980.1 hypothetical protein [Patescibacteria group bacterium]MBU1911635.1 hypothetical protein [Patescibacteria group bacterium]